MKNFEIVESLEKITGNSIGNNITIFPNGKNKTIRFYNCDLEKYFKCTLKYDCLISNIREIKN